MKVLSWNSVALDMDSFREREKSIVRPVHHMGA